MKYNNCEILCIILTIIAVGMLIKAAFNEGRLWNEQEYYKCSSNSGCAIGRKCVKLKGRAWGSCQ